MGIRIMTDNLIANGDFRDGYTGWSFHAPKGSTFNLEASGGARLTVSQKGDNVQLYQSGLSLKPGTRYQLTFIASSGGPHSLSVFIHAHGSPYEPLGLSNYVVSVGDEPKSFSTFFTTPELSSDSADSGLPTGRLRFWLAPYASAGSSYWFNHISLEEASGPVVEPPAPRPPRRHLSVLCPRLEKGDSLEVRYVPPEGLIVTNGDIDWEATPWRLLAVYYQRGEGEEEGVGEEQLEP